MLPFLLYFTKQILFSSLFASTTTALPLQNITLELPAGTSNRGTPGLLCTPTKWTDLVCFYLFNYVAHAATVITQPGEQSVDFAVTVIGCLLHPAMGLYRGIEAILSGAALCKGDDLRKAARSGALCMVVRTRDWRPVDGLSINNAILKEPTIDQKEHDAVADETTSNEAHLVVYQPPISASDRLTYAHRQTIHGTFALPPGYGFVVVPPDTRFSSVSSNRTNIRVASTYNGVKALICLAQTIYASLTLYRSRGDQISQFGFAAFGLTVAPYAVMSTVNLFGNLCRPDYASLYMVESGAMDEARSRGGMFDGTVARVSEVQGTNVSTNTKCSVVCANISRDKESGDLRIDIVQTCKHASQEASSPDLDDALSVTTATDSTATFTASPSFGIKGIPPNLDYSETEGDYVLFIPCCEPLDTAASTASTIEDTGYSSPQYSMTKALLHQPHWFVKTKQYSLHFRSSAASSFRCRLRTVKYASTLLVALAPLIITAVMTGFKPGTIPNIESSTWKSYTMQWLMFGILTGLSLVFDQEGKEAECRVKGTKQKWYRRGPFGPKARTLFYIVSASPAVGGFIVVGQMLSRYGVCVWVGD